MQNIDEIKIKFWIHYFHLLEHFIWILKKLFTHQGNELL